MQSMNARTEQSSLSASSFIALLLPGVSLIACVLFLAATALMDAYQWYEAAAHAYQPAAWYAYPWHWPGVHLAEEGWIWLQGYVPFLNGSSAVLADDPPTLPLAAILWLLRAVAAVAIDTAIALLPLIVLGQVLRLANWTRTKFAAA
jgi:hypothetical protein